MCNPHYIKSNAIFLAHKDAIHKAHLSINAASYPRRLIAHDANKLFLHNRVRPKQRCCTMQKRKPSKFHFKWKRYTVAITRRTESSALQTTSGKTCSTLTNKIILCSAS